MSFYQNSFEYLSDELDKLDMLLKYHFEKERSEVPETLKNSYSDLFISSSKIEYLLSKKEKEVKPDGRLEELNEKINQKEREIHEKLEVSRENAVYLPFDILQQLFDLSYHEIQILIIALAPVIDSKYEKIYGYR
ncbi:MAG: hypothetical protein OEV66_07705 [Spirochaetia bacterium]|nr:hypothetical protein [Spirochaetia bacterium]